MRVHCRCFVYWIRSDVGTFPLQMNEVPNVLERNVVTRLWRCGIFNDDFATNSESYREKSLKLNIDLHFEKLRLTCKSIVSDTFLSHSWLGLFCWHSVVY